MNTMERVLAAFCEEYQKDIPKIVEQITPAKIGISAEALQVAINKLYDRGLICGAFGDTLMSVEGVCLTDMLWPTAKGIDYSTKHFNE